MNHKSYSPKFKPPPLIPIDVIRFYYTVLADINYKKAIYIFLIVSCVNGIYSIYTSGTAALIIGNTACLLIGIYAFFHDFFKGLSYKAMKSNEVQYLLLTGDKRLQPSKKEKDHHGYESVEVPYRTDSIIYSKLVNTYLRECSSTIKVHIDARRESELKDRQRGNSEVFREILLWKLRDSRSNGKMFFDGDTISLATDIHVGTKEVTCFKSSYFLSYLTNELSTLDIENHVNKEEPIIKSEGRSLLYSVDHGVNVLKSLNRSLFSNHIGGNTIGISTDGLLCLWRQGTRSQRSSNLLAPTGSGSLDWCDYVHSNKTLSSMISNGMERELREESTKTNCKISNHLIAETKILGYYRWCGKGGLPGFLAVSKLNVSSRDLIANAAEVDNPQELETSFDASDMDTLRSSVEDLLKLRNDVSVPLYANLLCLRDVIKETPEYLNFLFETEASES